MMFLSAIAYFSHLYVAIVVACSRRRSTLGSIYCTKDIAERVECLGGLPSFRLEYEVSCTTDRFFLDFAYGAADMDDSKNTRFAIPNRDRIHKTQCRPNESVGGASDAQDKGRGRFREIFDYVNPASQ